MNPHTKPSQRRARRGAAGRVEQVLGGCRYFCLVAEQRAFTCLGRRYCRALSGSVRVSIPVTANGGPAQASSCPAVPHVRRRRVSPSRPRFSSPGTPPAGGTGGRPQRGAAALDTRAGRQLCPCPGRGWGGRPPARCRGDAGPAERRLQPPAARPGPRSRSRASCRRTGAGAAPACGAGHRGAAEKPQAARREPPPGHSRGEGPLPFPPPLWRPEARVTGAACVGRVEPSRAWR